MNPLVCMRPPREALLALEDGTVLRGRCAGATGEAFGEIVFNTSMVGYQEIVTDPSYAGQIVTLTYPQVGNYGVSAAAMQSGAPALAGLVVRDMCYEPSNWQSEGSLPELLEREGVVAIEGVDTRALTLRIRSAGAMRAAISTEDLDPQSLVARVCQAPGISSRNLVADVSPRQEHVVPAKGERRFRVVAYDCGEKRGIADGLASVGCETVVVPWDTPAERTLALGIDGARPDGVFFSNGPGDPGQVTATAHAARELLGKVPVFGICLGNQLVSMAAGARIEKLPFGHHGGNEPVMNLLTSKVEVTAQNHNFGLVFDSLGPIVPEESGGYAEHERDLRAWCRRGVAPVVRTAEMGRVRLTHVNLNDGTPEGVQFLDVPALSVQYHPEACPGPHDSAYLFRSFARLMEGDADYLDIDVREGRRF
ncbi:MAG: carbamoyl-phosphate synthase small subunit [Coriobacteriaceae bacterium]|nr:MAG: carbamoyl-phosphate synthase small subunit [Coriobacteriaceae bacterium]